MIERILRESFLLGTLKKLSRKMFNSKMGPSEDHGLVNAIKAVDWVKPRRNKEFVVQKGRLDNSPRFRISNCKINKG